MFMFWSKRTLLTRRLLKAKVRGEHETECETQEDSSSRIHRTINTTGAGNDTSGNVTTAAATATGQTSKGARGAREASLGGAGGGGRGGGGERGARASSMSSKLHQGCCGGDQNYDDDENARRLLRCKELLKTLKDNQLEMLVAAVESYGADLGSCVLVPRQRPFHDSDSDSEPDDRLHHRQENQQEQQYHRAHRMHQHYHRHLRHLHRHHRHHQRYHRGRRRSSEDENENENDNNEHEIENEIENENENEEQQRSSPEEPFSAMRAGRCATSRVPGRSSMENTSMDPHLLFCQIWRWPDLVRSDELKRLPVCHSAKDPIYVCCNPYHWSRLCKPESPPPPYCLITDRLRPEDRAPSEGDQHRCKNSTLLPLPGSLTTNGEDETGQKEWCTLAYWELGGRVGRLYPVEPSTVNVFDSLHDGDGLCLATLAENHTAPLSVQKTRRKIGLGLTLSQEADGVWAYNRSENPIFVNSPTLDDPESRTLLVYRVPPGFCLNIFDRAKVLQLPYYNTGGNSRSNVTSGFPTGPIDINSVRISFAKGWGPKYSRQEITSCPCWLEVLLAPCR